MSREIRQKPIKFDEFGMYTGDALQYDYQNVTYCMSQDELDEFMEDNAHYDPYLYIYHYQYFNFLHHLYNMAQTMPLYYYKDASTLTRYYPPEPPRVFFTYFSDLTSLWEARIQEISSCFTIKPGLDITRYSTPREVKDTRIEKWLGKAYLNVEEKVYLKQQGFVAFEEIWVEDMSVNPISLPLSLRLNANNLYSGYSSRKDKRSSAATEYMLSREALRHLMPFMSLLPVYYENHIISGF